MRKIVTVSALAALFVSPALAADLKQSMVDTPIAGTTINWTGVHIGAHGGYGTSSHELGGSASYKGEEFASAFIDGIGGRGAFGGVSVGADVARGHFLVGVFGDYNFSGVEAKAGLSIDGDTYGASIKEGDSWMVGGRVGYLFGSEKRALLYGLAGWGETDVTYGIDGIDGVGSKDVTFSGVVVGAGSEYALTKYASIGIEYQHFFGGEETLSGKIGGADATITDDHETDKVMARLRLKLTGSAFGY